MLNLQNCIKSLSAFKKANGHRLGIERLGIFGSVARQQNTEDSDLDVVVEMERPTLRNMFELEESLKELFGCKVDLVQMRPTLRPLLKSNIQKEAIYV
jgi:predicted nucleotidyltransferase